MGDKHLKYNDLLGGLNKYPGKRRSKGPEIVLWVEFRDKKVLRIKYPKKHSKDVPVGTVKSIRNQTELSEKEFYGGLIGCPLRGVLLEARYEHYL